jgi:hypothetical protein
MRGLIFLTLLFLSSQSFAFNSVSKFVLEKQINQNYFTNLDIDYRALDHDFFRRHYDLGIGYKLKNTEFEIKYRHIYRNQTQNNDWKLSERRPQIQITHNFSQEKFTIQARIRHDYRIFSNQQSQRARLRLRLISKEKFFKYFQPLISNEFFYNIDDDYYSDNRFEIGVILPELMKITPSLFFRNDSDFIKESRNWQSDQFLVLRFDANF